MNEKPFPPQWQTRSRQHISVLVIEDEESFRQLLCQLLEVSGLSVFSARNGKEGLALFTEVQPKIVITDIIMPDTDGIEVIEAIKRHDDTTPVIAMAGNPTGESQKSFLSLALLRGANAVIHKPINMDVLHRTIDEMLELHYPALLTEQGTAEQ